MNFGPQIDELIKALGLLPGVGRKSAQRMALYLLDGNRPTAARLANALNTANEQVQQCQKCRNLSDQDICKICRNVERDESIVCVVESPSDLVAIEQGGQYQGQYFVLSGSLSPIDGRGPEQIGIPQLLSRVSDEQVQEVILATNPTMEGEATAHFIGEALSNYPLTVSRLAHGIPLGSELGYIDSGTLSHALSGRQSLDKK